MQRPPQDAIVVLDALCRERYIIDHEQAGKGPLEDKFGLQAKQVRKVLQGLHVSSLATLRSRAPWC
jgi:hypothetical protein